MARSITPRGPVGSWARGSRLSRLEAGGQVFHRRLPGPHAGEIFRLVGGQDAGHPMHEEIGFPRQGGLDGEGFVHPLHGLRRLVGDDAFVAAPLEEGAKLNGSEPQVQEIVPRRKRHAFHPAAHAHSAQGLTEDRRLEGLVRRPDFAHGEHRGHEAFRVAQGIAPAWHQRLRPLGIKPQHHRPGPPGAIRKPPGAQDGEVIRPGTIPFQGGIAAIEEELQVAQCLAAQVEVGQIPRLLPQRGGPGLIHDEVDESATVGRNQSFHATCHACP
jgi:hypothetical protein